MLNKKTIILVVRKLISNIKKYILIYILIVVSKYKNYRLKKSITLFNGRDVLILGSSPNPLLPSNHREMLLVCCNGSAANANRLNMPSPAMTIVDFELIDKSIAFEKDSRKKIITGQILSGLKLGILVATQSNDSVGGSPELLGSWYDHFFEINRFERRKIIDYVTGVKRLERDVNFSLCSTGGFAIAISLFLGARSVTISGFTHLFSGTQHSQMHFYDIPVKNNSKEWNTRNHTVADSALISLSTINGYHIFTLEPDILPLTQNWGNEGPSW